MDTEEQAPRIPLSRDRVLQAAIGLADAEGIDSLTMRRLGQELGVEAMSLYNHVANKEDILDGVVDEVISRFGLPDPDRGWKESLRSAAISANEVLLSHPWASSLMLSRTNAGPARLGHMNAVLGTLAEAGLSAELTDKAFHALESHILGFTLQQVSFPFEAEELKEVGARFLDELDTAAFPHLAEHVIGHIEQDFETQGGFAFGLDLILDGLERADAA